MMASNNTDKFLNTIDSGHANVIGGTLEELGYDHNENSAFKIIQQCKSRVNQEIDNMMAQISRTVIPENALDFNINKIKDLEDELDKTRSLIRIQNAVAHITNLIHNAQ